MDGGSRDPNAGRDETPCGAGGVHGWQAGWRRGSGRDAVAEPLAPAATIDPDVARSLPKIENRPGLRPGPRGTIRRRHALQAWAPARSAPRATPARTLRSL